MQMQVHAQGPREQLSTTSGKYGKPQAASKSDTVSSSETGPDDVKSRVHPNWTIQQIQNDRGAG